MKFLSDIQIEQGCDMYLKGISNAGADMDMFVVVDLTTKKLMYRTGAQLLSDVGAEISGTASGLLTTHNSTFAHANIHAPGSDASFAIASETSDNQCYPLFVTSIVSPQGARYDAAYFQYDALNHNLKSTTFTGALVGNASTATNATNSTNIFITSVSTNYAFGLVLVDNTGNVAPKMADLGLSYNPSIQVLSCTLFKMTSGAAAGKALTSDVNGLASWATPWTAMGYVTGTPWTAMGYVTGTHWTAMGYLTSVTSHSHGNLTNVGAIGSTSGLPVITGASGVVTTGSFGTTSGTFCQGSDSRLSDSRIASDVYAWAKASTKPTYTYSEVGAAPSSTVSFPGFGTTSSTACIGNDSRVLNGQTAFGWGNHSGLYTPVAHSTNYSNPHSTTAAQVSLGNVTNESKATMFSSPIFSSSMGLDGVSGTNSEFLMKKSGSISAANVGYYFSHRSTNTDLTLYSYNGSAYASVFEATRSGVTKWGASTYHTLQNYAGTLQFESNSSGVNIPAGKTYQIGGVDVIGGSSPQFLTANYTIQAASMNGMVATPIKILTEPGAGKYIDLVSVTVENNITDATYDGGHIYILTTSSPTASATNTLFIGNSFLSARVTGKLMPTNSNSYIELPTNTGIYLKAGTTDTCSSGNIVIKMTYRIITI